MDRPNYEDEDSNHSINGWIKKEIDDDDFEEFMKQEQEEEHSGDRYEELMNLSKEDLVGRILQQEEDIRYLQDIRHGLEKNVQGFSASCVQFKRLLEVMSSTISSFKDCQLVATTASSSGTVRHTTVAPTLPSTSRSNISAPATQASPRSTPTVATCTASAATASPRSTPSIPTTVSNPRSTANSSSIQSSQMTTSSVVSNDRLHKASSMSSHQTVTITKQTNVVIKTEIPSPPPPEPMITSSPMLPTGIPSSSSSMTHSNQKSRSEAPPLYQMRQQQAVNNAKTFTANSSRSITDIANSIPSYRQRARVNPNMSFPSNVSAVPKINSQPGKNMQEQFNMKHQPSTAFISGRGARGRANVSHRTAPYVTQRPSPMTSSAGVTTMLGRPRAAAPPSVSSVSPSSSASSSVAGSAVNDILANISLKVPSGITLSIVSPKSTSEPRTQQSNVEKSTAACNPTTRTASAESSSRSNVSQSSHTSNTAAAEEGNASKAPVDKSASSTCGTNSSFSNTNAISDVTGNYQDDEDDDEEDDYFDEIAVLIPDKKSSPGLEGSGAQTVSDVATNNAIISVDALPKNQPRPNKAFWNSQSTGQKSRQAAYPNNAEYMFEESEDIDSDENDAKVYLGENVSLPRELVDSCIKQGQTPTKLTRNLMKALFPDMRELASGCAEGDTNRPSQPLLPANKVKAIITLVQEKFPMVKRSAIILAMNMKCKEARVLLGRSGSQQYSSF